MRGRASRAVLGAALSGALALMATLTMPLATVRAAETTTTVQFAGCEIRPYASGVLGSRIGAETTWSPTLRFTHPSPIPVNDMVTTEVELGPLPAGTVPIDMFDVTLYVYDLEFSSQHSTLFRFYAEVPYESIAAGQPITLPELEYDASYSEPGSYEHRVKKIRIYFAGNDAAGDFVEYVYECDQVVNPQTILTTAVYDLSAGATVSLDATSARQGAAVRMSGTNMLAAAPSDPRALATVTIGGVAVGAFPIDDSGSFTADVRVPAFVAAGNLAVRATNGSRSASSTLTVTALKASVQVTPKRAKRGKKITLKGSSFKPGESVRITLKGGRKAGRKAFAKSVKVSAAGGFSVKIKLKGAAVGRWTVRATGASSRRTGAGKFTVK